VRLANVDRFGDRGDCSYVCNCLRRTICPTESCRKIRCWKKEAARNIMLGGVQLGFLCFLLLRRFFLGQRAKIVDHVPYLLGFHAAFLTGHLALALDDDVIHFAIRQVFQRG
jgi:hypothetical protein